MKNANGYGSITKLSGNRRRPYVVRITTSREIVDGKAKQNRKVLGYYATRKEAMIALAEYNKNPYELDRRTVTVEEVWKLCKEKTRVSDDRKKVYEGVFNNYLAGIGKRTVSSLHGEELQAIVDNCQHGYSTKVIIKVVLKHIFSYSLEKDIVDKDITQFVKIESEDTQLERQIYSDNEIKDIISNQGNPFYDFTIILLYQGMRLKELRDLTKENVDFVAGTISITEAKNKQSVRIIPIHEKALELLKKNFEKSNTDKIFNFSKSQYEFFVKNNLNHLPYDTRHTFATKANNFGIKKVFVQRIMGHKPDSVLEEFYTHISIDELKAEINKVVY